MKIFKSCAVLINLLLLSTAISAQAPATTQGVEYYRRGDFKNAISVLKNVVKNNKTDGEAFYVLGAAQLRENDFKNAKKSLETAAKLLPQDARPLKSLTALSLARGKNTEARTVARRAIVINQKDPEAQYLLGVAEFRSRNEAGAIKAAEAAIALDKSYAAPYLLKADTVIYDGYEKNWYAKAAPAERANRFLSAARMLEDYPDSNQNEPNAIALRNRLEGLKVYYEFFKKRENQVDSDAPAQSTIETPDPSVTKLKILTKPQPGYTDKARQNYVEGSITVLVLFAKDGTIQYPIVLSSLGGGLEQKVLAAAQAIKFEPQKKDGQPVSVVKLIEYNFQMY